MNHFFQPLLHMSCQSYKIPSALNATAANVTQDIAVHNHKSHRYRKRKTERKNKKKTKYQYFTPFSTLQKQLFLLSDEPVKGVKKNACLPPLSISLTSSRPFSVLYQPPVQDTHSERTHI